MPPSQCRQRSSFEEMLPEDFPELTRSREPGKKTLQKQRGSAPTRRIRRICALAHIPCSRHPPPPTRSFPRPGADPPRGGRSPPVGSGPTRAGSRADYVSTVQVPGGEDMGPRFRPKSPLCPRSTSLPVWRGGAWGFVSRGPLPISAGHPAEGRGTVSSRDEAE